MAARILNHSEKILLCATAILFNTNNYLAYAIAPAVQKIIYILVFTTTYLLPSLTAMLLVNRGKINSLQMEQSRERNIPFRLLTNNSQRARRDVVTKLSRLGIDIEEENVFTSAMATARPPLARIAATPSSSRSTLRPISATAEP